MYKYPTNQVDNNVNLNLSNQYLFQLGNGQLPPSQSLTYNGYKPKPVGVFWDIENCSIPRGANILGLVGQIRSLFNQFNLTEREFVVVCDVYGINHTTINELNDMQVNIIHVCSFSKNACDEKLKQLIYRFVMTYGEMCTIILLSSDINFAPILSDIKNRLGSSVILFHHRQVSDALLACANYSYDFDYFCSNIQTHSLKKPFDSDLSNTYLTISNWPRNFTEENTRMFLQRLTGNSGGKVVHVNHQNFDATVMFKCKSDAQRCLQRVNNRHINGMILKAYINVNFNPNSSSETNSNQTQTRQTIENRRTPIENDNFRSCSQPNERTQSIETTETESNLAPILAKLKSNRCELCFSGCKRLSIHSNYMFKSEILSIHISLDELSKKMEKLLELHPHCRIPLNSLPHCWLNSFGQEMDTKTEPKVMLEHLLSCLDKISIRTIDVEIDGEVIPSKFIVRKSNSEILPDLSKLSKKQKRKLKPFSALVKKMLINASAQSLTSFPSILLSKLLELHKINSKKTLKLRKKFGTTNLNQIFHYLSDQFNLYSYNDDYLLALNFNEQKKRFIEDASKALSVRQCSSIESDELDYETFMELYKRSFGTEINIAVYGVCSFNDMVDNLQTSVLNFRNESECSSESSNLVPNGKDSPEILDEEPINFIDREIYQSPSSYLYVQKCVPLIHQFLLLQPSLSIQAKLLYEHVLPHWKEHLSMHNCDYSKFIQSFSLIDSCSLRVLSINDTEWILLSPKLLQIEQTKRIIRIFYLMSMIGKEHSDDCNCLISFSINQIYAQYLKIFGPLSYKEESLTSLSKLFEKFLIIMYRKKLDEDFCVIYYRYDVFLQKLTLKWISEQCLITFLIIFGSKTGTVSWRQLKTYYRENFNFNFGVSCLEHPHFREMIQLCTNKEEEEEEVYLKLSPIYEFAANCLIVMLAHSNENSIKWSINQLELEYDIHFNVQILKPSHFAESNYKSLFKRIDILFKLEENENAESQIVLSQAELFRQKLGDKLENRLGECPNCAIIHNSQIELSLSAINFPDNLNLNQSIEHNSDGFICSKKKTFTEILVKY